MTLELTAEEKATLASIAQSGTLPIFSGMLYNQLAAQNTRFYVFTDQDVIIALKNALKVRIVLSNLAVTQ